jgi:hypothetical protein
MQDKTSKVLMAHAFFDFPTLSLEGEFVVVHMHDTHTYSFLV